MTVAGVEFAAVDVEVPIRDSNKVDCWSLGDLYQTAASKQDESGHATAARVFGLLSAIVQIHFKPEDRSEPWPADTSRWSEGLSARARGRPS